MTAGNANELMQEGMKLVRAGDNAQAYALFKQVIAQDPNNEYAWIWVSVTSPDRSEKRRALNEALRVNPASQHAREALRNLDTEERNAPPAAVNAPPFQTQPMVAPPPFAGGAAPRIGATEATTQPNFNTVQPAQPDNLRAALTSEAKGKNKKVKQNQPKVKNAKSDPAPANGRNRPGRPRRFVFFLLSAIVLALLIIIGITVVLPRLNPAPTPETVASGSPTAAVTTTAPTTDAALTPGATMTATTSSAVTTTAPAVTTAPVATTTTPVATTGTAAAGTTTVPAGTTAPANATTSPASTTSAPATTVSGTNSQPLPPVTPLNNAGQVAPALETARDKLSEGDFRGAISSYQSVLQFDARNVQANLGLGNLYLTVAPNELPTGTNRYAEAIRYFRVVTSQAPNWSGGFAKLGEALASNGDTKSAIEAYSKSLQLDPNGPERWVALAALYEKDGQPEQARFARERAGIATPIPPTPIPAAPTPTPRR